MRGKSGALLCGGRTAAVLGDWSFDGSPNDWSLNAAVRTVDEYWLTSASKYTLSLDVGSIRWRWQVTDVTVSGDQMTIHGAGAPEKR